jgi:hypothetical protein
MRAPAIALALVVVALAALLAEAAPDLDAENTATFDPHLHHTTLRDGMTADEVRLAGHIAHYALASVLRFPTMEMARDKLADIASGATHFRQVAEDLNKLWLLRGERRQSSGEVGLVVFNEMETELAKLVFDIRNPEAAEHNMNLLGPVQTDTGVWVGAAFKRYRKQFFNRAWWELDEFCRGANMKTSEILQLIENQDRMWQMSFMIWPEEHVSFKRLKIRQVKEDFRRIGGDDPATQMPAPRKKLDPHVHRAHIDERIAFMKKIDPQIIKEHPEIYAMSVEQIRERGWHPDDAAAERAKERYRSESKSKSASEQAADPIDPSKFAL